MINKSVPFYPFIRLGTSAETVGYGYDSVNRRTSLTLPNGIQTQYSYDNADQLTGLSYLAANGNTLGTLVYGYDSAGRRISQTGNWASDQLPNATASDYQYNPQNRLTGGNSYAPAYDNEGQMTQDEQGRSYVWDARHQLSQILQGTVPVASFQYDAFGRRVQKTVNGTATAYLYDGDNPIQEQQGSALSNILTGAGIDERYARDDSIGRTYYLADALGSTIAVADGSGNIQQQYAYEPYGTYSASGQAGLTNPYTYTGRENDGTGLYYYRARYYSPQMMRFIAEDPLGLGGGPNVYAYVGGNPISRTDRRGLSPNDGMFGLSPGQLQFLGQVGSNPDAVQYFESTGRNPLTAAADEDFSWRTDAQGQALLDAYSLLSLNPALEGAGAMCRVATPKNTRAIFTALRMFERLYGSPETVDTVEEFSQEMAEQRLLPGGKLNPTPRPPAAPPPTGGP